MANPIAAFRLRERDGRQLVFLPVTRLLCCLLIALMAVPSGLWACPPPPQNCTTPCCGGSSGGSSGGIGGFLSPLAGGFVAGDDNQIATELDPVHLGTLAVYLMSKELTPLPQPGGLTSATLAFGRFYSSQNESAGPLGAGWTHNYNVSLTKVKTNPPPSGQDTACVTIKDWTATEQVFYYITNNEWAAGANVNGGSKLKRGGNNNFIWELRHGTKYTFEQANDFRLASIKDRADNKVSLTYDQHGWLTNAADDTGRAVKWVNDAHGRITQMTDPLNRTNFYDYDGSGQLTNVSDGLGLKAAYVYQSGHTGRVVTITNARGKAHSYAYDVAGRATAATNALGLVEWYGGSGADQWVGVTNRNGYAFTNYNNEEGYVTNQLTAAGTSWYFRDAANRVTQQVDPLGHTNYYVYDEGSCACQISGELLAQIDPLGRSNQWSYETNFHFATAFTNAAGWVTRWAYDNHGNRTGETNALAGVTVYRYDAAGNRFRILDAKGYKSTFAYDPYGNLTNAADPMNHTNTFSYDLGGRLTLRTDALGQTNAFTYDARDRRTQSVDALGKTNSWAYDGNGNVTGATNALGYATGYAYDDVDRLASMTLPESASAFTTYAYDGNGNRVGVTNALGKSMRYGYDALDRMTSITNALSKVWTLAYDANSRLTNRADPNQHTNWFTCDAAGQLTFLTDAENHMIEFQYDLAGNRTNIIDGRNNSLKFGYDPLNRLTNLVYAASDTEEFTYDPVDNLTNYLSRAGQRIQFNYDAVSRLTNKVYVGGSDAITFSYDAANRLTNAQWKVGGTTNSAVAFQYDAAGRLTSETQKITTATNFTVGYEYDNAGHRIKLTYPDNTFLTYGYNANGWLTNLSDGGTNTIVSYEYDAAGRRTKRVLENSTFTVLDYDVAGQITNIWHRQVSGGVTNTISQYQYGYDDAGQRTWVKRAGGKGDVYKYDAIGQLTNVLYEATNPDTTPSSWTNEAKYVFDAAGNRTSVDVTNTGTTSYTANSLNQYTSVGGTTYQYDGNGNLTNTGTWRYFYDRENRLIRSTNGAVSVTNVYDAFNRLIERQKGTARTRFIYDNQWRVIAEYDENNSLQAKYVYGPEIDEPVRMTRGGTNYYYHAAALGTVTEITSTNGTLLESYRYDVYGEPTILSANNDPLSTSAIGNRLLFQGRDRDPDTGLYNFRNRYYSPSLGRFLQVDLIREEGGLNLYGFVGNKPTVSSDPWGLSWRTDLGKLLQVILNLAAGVAYGYCAPGHCNDTPGCQSCCNQVNATMVMGILALKTAGLVICTGATGGWGIGVCIAATQATGIAALAANQKNNKDCMTSCTSGPGGNPAGSPSP